MLITRIISLLLAFILGFASCAGVLVGGAYYALNNFKVRDIEKYGLADIKEEAFMGQNYEVDLLGLTAIGLVNEIKTLSSMSDELDLNLLISRYDLKLPSEVNDYLPDEALDIPIKNLFSEEAIFEILSTVYVGSLQKFECHAIDSDEPGDPSLGKDGARWYDPSAGKYVTGIGETVAFFSLGAFASGDINIDSVLHDLKLADVFGYTCVVDENGNETWYDGDAKVTGIMSVFAGCTLDNVTDKINSAHIGDLIGYETVDGVWYMRNEESGELERVSGFMSKIADSSITSIGGVFDTLTIADIVEEEDRQSGIFAIIPADTEITDIGGVVNDSITKSPMQFFMAQGMIVFGAEQQNTLDDLCAIREEMTVFAADNEEFVKHYYSEDMTWEMDEDGNYLVPTWRTQPLNASFSYIVGLLSTPTVPDIPNIPDIDSIEE